MKETKRFLAEQVEVHDYFGSLQGQAGDYVEVVMFTKSVAKPGTLAETRFLLPKALAAALGQQLLDSARNTSTDGSERLQ